MTSDLDSHTTTDVKPDMLSGVQTGNRIPHDRYNKRGIAHLRTNKKDNIFHAKPTRATLYIGLGQRTCKKSKQYPARAYTTLGVFVLLFEALPYRNKLKIVIRRVVLLKKMFVLPLRTHEGMENQFSFQVLSKASKNTCLAAPGALTHRLQQHTAFRIQNGC